MKHTIGYPRASRRIQAILLDSIIIPAGTIGTLIVASLLGLQGVSSVVLAGLVVIFLEPFLVSVTGGTLGHHLLGIRVVSQNTTKNINIFSAVLRFIAKIPLGIFSIASIFTTRKHQAIHDLLIGSIVILKRPQSMNSHDVLGEREVEEQGYSYPSKIHRMIIIILYNLALFKVLDAFFRSLFESCVMYNQCAWYESIIAYSLPALWLMGIIASVILCWKGLLFGCRRKLITDS